MIEAAEIALVTMRPVSEKELVYPARLSGRIRVGMRELSNWFQFGRYPIVSASGYGVSIATFAILYDLVGATYWIAATGAFGLALTNNFLWNRRWTFGPVTATSASRPRASCSSTPWPSCGAWSCSTC
jgi:hypothetical protein